MSKQSPSEGQVDITPNKDGGVLKEILVPGEGDQYPHKGVAVCVHYTGTLEEDGSKFDSSRDRSEKFTFHLGLGEVIKAWDIGVRTMKKGETARFTCRSDYAYGANGSPPQIPPNATLIFEVELFGWKEEDLSKNKDGGIIRIPITEGEGVESPAVDAVLDVHLRGVVNGTVFDERDVKFTLGEGELENIPRGIEKALEKFTNKEKSRIKLSPKYGYGAKGNSNLGVPPNANLEYEVELKSFVKAKPVWEMNPTEQLEQAKVCKEAGTNFFKDGKYSMAERQYSKIATLLSVDSGLNEEEKKELNSVKLAGHLNLSLCHLKTKNNYSAKTEAENALQMDPQNVKALFRKGQALLNLEEPELAQVEFKKCLELDKSNKAAAQQLQICVNKIKTFREKERNIYGGMFEKFARSDAKKANANNQSDVMTGDLGEWTNTNSATTVTDEIDKQLGEIEMLDGSELNGK